MATGRYWCLVVSSSLDMIIIVSGKTSLFCVPVDIVEECMVTHDFMYIIVAKSKKTKIEKLLSR